jgi:hypothetical protein
MIRPPITQKDIDEAKEKLRKEWIRAQVDEIITYVNRYTRYNRDDFDYKSFTYSKQIPKKYENTRDTLYADLKQLLPDSTVILNITQKNWLCFWKIYVMDVKVSWA